MKKHFFAIIFSIIFANISLFSLPNFLGGPGDTKDTAWEIWTIADINELRDSVDSDVLHNGFWNWCRDKHFRLMQDIGIVTQSIGWKPFYGHFHGGGHKIIVALVGSGTPPYCVGSLFSYVVFIDSLTVEGLSPVAGITGGGSTVTNCTSNVNITTIPGWGAGGIAYSNGGIISNCVFNGSIVSIGAISGIGGIGGIVGENECGVGGQIINCINNGKIIASTSGSGVSSGVGGIAGIRFNAGSTTLSGNINNGIVEGQNNVGGIIGRVTGITTDPIPASVTDNVNNGFVKGTTAVGGIIGSSGTATTNVNIFNNFNSGVVVGNSETGCIVGRNTGGTVSNNHYDKQMCGE